MPKLNLEPYSEEWFAYRRKHLTATDVPAVLGLSPWKTALSVWMEKTGRDMPKEEEESDSMVWGRLTEDVNRQWVEREAGVTIQGTPGCFEHQGYSWLAATPDGFVQSERGNTVAVWEGKTTNPFKKADWTMGVPEHYRVQVLTQMFVCGLERGLLSVIIPPQLKWAWIDQDPDFFHTVETTLTRFWEGNVLADIPPKATGSAIDTSMMKVLHPNDTGGIIDLSGEAIAASNRIQYLTKKLSEMKAEVDECKNLLRGELGANTYGRLPDGCAWAFSRTAKGVRVLKHVNRVPDFKQ